MKYLIFLLFLLPLASGCFFDKGLDGLIVNNCSDDTICVYTGNGCSDLSYPEDTLFPIMSGRNEKYWKHTFKYDNKVLPHTEKNALPGAFLDIMDDTIRIFIFKYRVAKLYTYKMLRENHLYLVRYDFGKEQFKSLANKGEDYRITYPPEPWVKCSYGKGDSQYTHFGQLK